MAAESDDARSGEAGEPDFPGRAAQDPDGDEYARSAWRSWLSALACDADAAVAAALAYDALPAEGRDAWLDALSVDAPMLSVPAIALYAPLLAVESDDARRDRIALALGGSPPPKSGLPGARAFLGVASDGTHACILVAPVYLQFVQVLKCRYTPDGGFLSVQHDPLRHAGDVAGLSDVEGVSVEPTPLGVVVDELAHAIVADRRERRATAPGLASFAHLFRPDLEHAGDAATSGP